MSADVVSSAAKLGLQVRLKEYEDVDVQVECSAFGLLGGAVDSLRVTGAGWCSPQGLRCRRLDFAVGRVALDTKALLSRGAIAVEKPVPSGEGRLCFTAADFASFLQHPLMVDASRTAVRGYAFSFDEEVSFDGDAVRFSGARPGGDVHRLVMRPVEPYKVQVEAEADSPESALVASEMARFFSGLSINLEGIELTYRGFEVRGDELDLDLGIVVHAFPPPLVSF